MEIENVLSFFETCQCVLWHVALTRLYWNDSFFTRCVRDWSGILLERSGKRYSGKPDAKRKAQIKCRVESVELRVYGQFIVYSS